jgi:hypothetical protein
MPFIEAAAFFAAGQRRSPRLHHTRTQFLFLQDSAWAGYRQAAAPDHRLIDLAVHAIINPSGGTQVDAPTAATIADSLE